MRKVGSSWRARVIVLCATIKSPFIAQAAAYIRRAGIKWTGDFSTDQNECSLHQHDASAEVPIVVPLWGP
jgi:hypothetical protein